MDYAAMEEEEKLMKQLGLIVSFLRAEGFAHTTEALLGEIEALRSRQEGGVPDADEEFVLSRGPDPGGVSGDDDEDDDELSTPVPEAARAASASTT